jgi:hypothetical protein
MLSTASPTACGLVVPDDLQRSAECYTFASVHWRHTVAAALCKIATVPPHRHSSNRHTGSPVAARIRVCMAHVQRRQPLLAVHLLTSYQPLLYLLSLLLGVHQHHPL